MSPARISRGFRKIRGKKGGTCPTCDSTDYSRQLENMTDDFVFFECECHNCKMLFKEDFKLFEQSWEVL